MSSEQAYIPLGTAFLGGALAYGLGGTLPAIAAFTVAGGSLGFAAAQIASGPGPDAIDSLTVKVEACFKEVKRGFEDAFGALPPLDQILEFGVITLISFGLAYGMAEAEIFDAAVIAGFTACVYIWARTGRAPEPAVAPPAGNGGHTPPAKPSKPCIPSPPPPPLTEKEEEEYPELLVEGNQETITALQSRVCGIQNKTASDCFMNATMQWLLHSPLVALLLDPGKHSKKPLGENWWASKADDISGNEETKMKEIREAHGKWRKENYEFMRFIHHFANFASAYIQQNGVTPRTDEMRYPLGLPPGQQDASEALARIAAMIDTSSLEWDMDIVRELDVDNRKETSGNDLSELEKNAKVDSYKEWLIKIHCPPNEKEIPLQKLIDNWLKRHKSEAEPAKYKEGDKLYEAPVKEEYIRINSQNEHLICDFQRYGFKRDGSKGEKLNYPIKAETPNVTVNGREYGLKEFVVHGGGLNGGHYTAYCVVGGEWHHFNDATVTVVSEADTLTAFSNATLAYFSEVPNVEQLD